MAEMASGSRKELRRAYGFDEVALVPGTVTVNPENVDLSFRIGEHTLSIPVLASAMDAVVDPGFAIKFGRFGGLAVLNLDGLQTRYDNPEELLAEIAQSSPLEVTSVLQKIYQQPIKPNLIGERLSAIKKGGVLAAASCTPQNASIFAPLAVEAGVDIFVVASTVTTARHISEGKQELSFDKFCKSTKVPVLVGNCVSYEASRELMQTGIAGLLVGVGPGAACTSREVLGVGVPQVTATIDCAAARDDYFAETGRYVPIITDGGMRNGGDISKAIAAGADAIMIGSPFAQAEEAPGRGFHWGMATPHAGLPRGTRIRVGINGSLQQILFGPTSRTDGTQNLMGALRTSMGVCGAKTIKEMQRTEMVIAPAIVTEGKIWQLTGSK
ncbi:MAG: GuaB3 family IMP dehydrogenase-related protein [Dehalococcoidales bacterium]|nr:GuaB3 family IMP dehydrogenase-related protein [Dehalococcoidales bacterium]